MRLAPFTDIHVIRQHPHLPFKDKILRAFYRSIIKIKKIKKNQARQRLHLDNWAKFETTFVFYYQSLQQVYSPRD